jgi:hypothetical protein
MLPHEKPIQYLLQSVPGFLASWFKEESMKNRVMIITLVIAVLSVFSSAPTANAEPLTVMAIVGVATVLSLSTIDIVATNHEDNKDQHAQQKDTGKMHAQAGKTEEAPSSSEVAVAARQN